MKEIMEKGLKTKKITCEIHGEQDVLDIWSHKHGQECPVCVQERLHEKEKALGMLGGEKAIKGALQRCGVGKRHLEATLDNYKIEHEGQKEAVAQCKWLLDNFHTATGLIFLGDKGTGKNHLAVALIREVILTLKKSARIISFLDYMREIKGGYSTNESEFDIVRRFTKPDLLIIDEVGRQFKSETELIMLHDLIDKRYLDMKPTVLITNMDIEQLKDVTDTPVIDRFTEGPTGKKTVHFDWPSYRRQKEY